mgnify:CR=1 FL=1
MADVRLSHSRDAYNINWDGNAYLRFNFSNMK